MYWADVGILSHQTHPTDNLCLSLCNPSTKTQSLVSHSCFQSHKVIVLFLIYQLNLTQNEKYMHVIISVWIKSDPVEFGFTYRLVKVWLTHGYI